MPFVETRIRISMAALAKMVCGRGWLEKWEGRRMEMFRMKETDEKRARRMPCFIPVLSEHASCESSLNQVQA